MNLQEHIKGDNLLNWGTREWLKPTIVLVHGAFEDASNLEGSYSAASARRLLGHWLRQPSIGRGCRHRLLASVLERIQSQVILVAHSYGGAVITQAGADARMSRASSMRP